MQGFLKWLRGFGAVGTAAANLVQILTANIGVTMSAGVALIAAIWGVARNIFLDDAVQVGIGVFLALLWTWIGVAVLRDRKKPREIRAHQDYRYGLTFEGIVPIFQPANKEAALQFSINLHNYSTGPIRYTIEAFSVLVEDRTLPPVEKDTMTAYMARGAGRRSARKPFKYDSIKDFIDKRVDGRIDISIVYGHPERKPERRLKLRVDIVLELKVDGPIGFGDNILEETDEPISKDG